MRLWHYKLIPYLPDSQLIAQWRELNAIYKNQPKHILINYVYEHDKQHLLQYSIKVLEEFALRGIRINNYDNYLKFFEGVYLDLEKLCCYPEHNSRYLMQCFRNLQEKYDRGQKDFTDERYKALSEFVSNEIRKEIL